MAESRRKKRTLLFPILPLLFSAFLPVVAHASVEGEADDQKRDDDPGRLRRRARGGDHHPADQPVHGAARRAVQVGVGEAPGDEHGAPDPDQSRPRGAHPAVGQPERGGIPGLLRTPPRKL